VAETTVPEDLDIPVLEPVGDWKTAASTSHPPKNHLWVSSDGIENGRLISACGEIGPRWRREVKGDKALPLCEKCRFLQAMVRPMRRGSVKVGAQPATTVADRPVEPLA